MYINMNNYQNSALRLLYFLTPDILLCSRKTFHDKTFSKDAFMEIYAKTKKGFLE